MTRVRNTNYRGGAPGTDFYLATDDSDPYSRELDVYGPALALDGHDHSAGKGLAVTRVAADAIDSAQIKAGAVTGPKLATGAVSQTNMANDSVGAAQIQAGAVGADEIVDGGVGSAEIAADAVLLTHLGHGAANRIFGTDASGVPSLLQLAALMVPNGILTGTMLAAGTVTNANLAGAIDLSTKAATGSLVNSNIATNTIDASAKVALGSVTEALIDGATSPNNEESLGWNGTQWYWRKIGYPQLLTSNTPADTQVLTWDNGLATMKWATPASGFTMAAGIVAAWNGTGANIPTGWVRESGLDGRMMVFDGTTFSTTWTAQNSYGSSWSHSSTLPNHVHSAAALGISGTSSGPSGTNTTGSTGNTSADGSHTHTPGSMDVTGNTDNPTTLPASTDTWTIPCRAYIPIVKS